jgi:hypothetical protein
VGFGVVAGEVDVAGHVDHPRADDFQSQVGNPGYLRHGQQGAQGRRAHPRVGFLADQELQVAVDQDDRDDAEQRADTDRRDGVGRRRAGQLVQAQPGSGDDQAGQGGRVLGEHGPQGGVGGGQDVLDHVPLERLGLAPGLPDRLQERGALQQERPGQHDVPDDEMPGRFRVDELGDAVRDRDRAAGHEQAERGEQRPHVRFAAVAGRVGGVGRAAGPPVGDQQEDLVAGVGPRVCRLGQQRRRPGQHGRGRLRHRDQQVGGERHQHRGEALGRDGSAQLRYQGERVAGFTRAGFAHAGDSSAGRCRARTWSWVSRSAMIVAFPSRQKMIGGRRAPL